MQPEKAIFNRYHKCKLLIITATGVCTMTSSPQLIMIVKNSHDPGIAKTSKAGKTHLFLNVFPHSFLKKIAKNFRKIFKSNFTSRRLK